MKFRLKIKFLYHYSKSLNRRAEVEQDLWDIYHAKKNLPSRSAYKEWALKLGRPDYKTSKQRSNVKT